MDNKEMVLFGGLGLALILIIVYAVIESDERNKDILRNHCVLIHTNKDIVQMEYDVSLKMMVPKRYPGKKIYNCDDNEWRVN